MSSDAVAARDKQARTIQVMGAPGAYNGKMRHTGGSIGIHVYIILWCARACAARHIGAAAYIPYIMGARRVR